MSAEIVTLDLDATVGADVLADALRALGAVVVWHGPKQPSATVVELKVTVEADDAAEALPGYYFESSDEWEQPDARDFGDFIAACRSGDRAVAGALLARLNLTEANLAVGERCLLSMASAA